MPRAKKSIKEVLNAIVPEEPADDDGLAAALDAVSSEPSPLDYGGAFRDGYRQALQDAWSMFGHLYEGRSLMPRAHSFTRWLRRKIESPNPQESSDENRAAEGGDA